MQSVEKGSGLGLLIWNFPGFSGEGRDLFGLNGEWVLCGTGGPPGGIGTSGGGAGIG